MTLSTPSGTRDVLPDEMAELRAILDALHGVFAAAGYGEIATPALEYEAVLARGDIGAPEPAYRLFDEHGNVMVLRSDMTMPIARVVATRYAHAATPLRFRYTATAHRIVRPRRGEPREILQAGVELIGAAAPEGTAEALSLLCAALDACGLGRARVGVGDAALYAGLLEGCGVPAAAHEALLGALVTRDFVGLERAIHGLGLDPETAALLAGIPQRRGGREVLDAVDGPAAAAVEGLRAVERLLAPEVAERVIFDLGLARSLGYYTGAIFEVYDPALGMPIGGGGRYDELLGRFGHDLPAVGFALDVERLHAALAAEEAAR